MADKPEMRRLLVSFHYKEGNLTGDNQTKPREEYRRSLSSLELPTAPTAPITLPAIQPSTIINVVKSSPAPVTQASSFSKKKRKGSVAFSAFL